MSIGFSPGEEKKEYCCKFHFGEDCFKLLLGSILKCCTGPQNFVLASICLPPTDPVEPPKCYVFFSFSLVLPAELLSIQLASWLSCSRCCVVWLLLWLLWCFVPFPSRYADTFLLLSHCRILTKTNKLISDRQMNR